MLVHPAHQSASVSLDRCSAAHIHYWLALVNAAAFFFSPSPAVVFAAAVTAWRPRRGLLPHLPPSASTAEETMAMSRCAEGI